MTLLIDAFGGDNAPLEVIKGALLAKKELGVDVSIVGDEHLIRSCADENRLDISSLGILHAEGAVKVSDSPRDVLHDKKDSSMGVGLRALAEGRGDAFVSAGSSAALVVGAMYLTGRIKGIKRPAFATVMPSNEGCFLLADMGANLECKPDALVRFAEMGDIYMRGVVGVKRPRVALANIGVEPEKGPELQRETYKLLSGRDDLDFIGNIEVRDIPFGGADVIVCDGYTGNLILKTYEGTALALMKNVKGIFMKNALTKLSALTLSGGIKALKKKLDYTEYGGAPILGVKRPVIKAHGSSDAKAFFSALRQARDCVSNDVCGRISALCAAEEQND